MACGHPQRAPRRYITWDRYQENLRLLASNGHGYDAARGSPPREGAALLQGRAVCGRCGQHIRVRYRDARGRLESRYIPPAISSSVTIGHSIRASAGSASRRFLAFGPSRRRGEGGMHRSCGPIGRLVELPAPGAAPIEGDRPVRRAAATEAPSEPGADERVVGCRVGSDSRAANADGALAHDGFASPSTAPRERPRRDFIMSSHFLHASGARSRVGR